MSFHWNGQAVSDEIRRRANMGVAAATIHLTNRIKEVISVPAPRVRYIAKSGVAKYKAGWLQTSPYALLINARTGKLSTVTSYRMVRGQVKPITLVYKPSPATPGAPPRKLSGRLRASWTYELDQANMIGRSGTNVKYARKHERGNHPFAMITLQKYRAEIETLLGTLDFDARTVYPTNP